MRTVNIHEAKTHLSRLVERAAKGESFVIAKAGKPMARITALHAPEPREQRRLGGSLKRAGFQRGQYLGSRPQIRAWT